MDSATALEWPIPIENSLQVSLLVTSSLAVFITCLFVGLRLFAKFKMSKPFDASDACIFAALVRLSISLQPLCDGADGWILANVNGVTRSVIRHSILQCS